MTPAQNAAEAARLRRSSREPGLSAAEVDARLAKAEEHQAGAVAGGAETGKNADDGVDF